MGDSCVSECAQRYVGAAAAAKRKRALGPRAGILAKRAALGLGDVPVPVAAAAAASAAAAAGETRESSEWEAGGGGGRCDDDNDDCGGGGGGGGCW